VSGDRCEITVLKSFRIFYGKGGKYSKMLATTGVTIEKQQEFGQQYKNLGVNFLPHWQLFL